MMEFEAFPKIARLNRNCTITEKIDGTNAAVLIEDATDDVGAVFAPAPNGYVDCVKVWVSDRLYIVQAQSRKRLITPGKGTDNSGFAAWVYDNAEELVATLGEGRHFGEWWGQGIQRGYGLDHKRFSLFNSLRWKELRSPLVHVVPTLYVGPFDSRVIDEEVRCLRDFGSQAAPGFQPAEGVVVYHHASREYAKVTCVNDEKPKGQVDDG